MKGQLKTKPMFFGFQKEDQEEIKNWKLMGDMSFWSGTTCPDRGFPVNGKGEKVCQVHCSSDDGLDSMHSMDSMDSSRPHVLFAMFGRSAPVQILCDQVTPGWLRWLVQTHSSLG